MTTIADRQQKYREKQSKNGARRLDMILGASEAHYLDMLSLHGNKTKKQMISELLEREYSRLLNVKESSFEQFVASENKK